MNIFFKYHYRSRIDYTFVLLPCIDVRKTTDEYIRYDIYAVSFHWLFWGVGIQYKKVKRYSQTDLEALGHLYNSSTAITKYLLERFLPDEIDMIKDKKD